MSVIAEITTKEVKKEKHLINPFIIITLCALTLSLFSLLIFIIFLHYENNRIIDLRHISRQYHEIIQSIFQEANLENRFYGYNEQINNKKWIITGEYDVFLTDVNKFNEI